MLQPIAEPVHQHLCKTADGLATVLTPGVNLSLWQRPPISVVADELQVLDAGALPDARLRVARDTFTGDCAALLQRHGLAPAGFRNWLHDVGRLLELFLRLVEDRPVTLRLETLNDDGCPRFHIDRTYLRLLCTYRGPGTEWLTNHQVNRAALGCSEPNEAILLHGAPARFNPFWVGIMKGARFAGDEHNALVHRSPPLAGTGQTRVLLCLDASPD